MPTKEEILEYLKLLKPELEEVGIVKIGLFGSYAKGTADFASDIDVAIESTTKLIDKTGGGFEAIAYIDDLRKRIAKQFKLPVDVCDTASMPKDKKEILLEGVIYV